MSTNYFPRFYCVKKQASTRKALSVDGEACPEDLFAGDSRAPCDCDSARYNGKCLYDLSFEETVELYLNNVMVKQPQSNEVVSEDKEPKSSPKAVLTFGFPDEFWGTSWQEAEAKRLEIVAELESMDCDSDDGGNLDS